MEKVSKLNAVRDLLVGEDTVYAASIPVVRAGVKEPIGHLTCARFDLDDDYMALIVRKTNRELTTYGVKATKKVTTICVEKAAEKAANKAAKDAE